MAKARDYCFTAYQEEAPTSGVGVTYLTYQREICPDTGRKHWQGYAEFSSPKAMTAAQRCMAVPGAHMEKRRGKPSEAAAYCQKEESRKEGTMFVEEGERRADPNPGKRTDLLTLKRMMDEGKTEKELWDQEFGLMTHAHKAMKAYKDAGSRAAYRTEMTKGLWYWGPTGVGKSHKVFEDFDPEKCYVHETADKGWWDGYDGHEIVIINDFRGDIKYSELLQLIDKWPKKVQRRGREPVPFVAKEIRITSSMSPESVYNGINEKESLDQLLRRLTVIDMTPPRAAPLVFRSVQA